MRIDRTREHSASFAPLPAICEEAHETIPMLEAVADRGGNDGSVRQELAAGVGNEVPTCPARQSGLCSGAI
jgi:hypothetical protein